MLRKQFNPVCQAVGQRGCLGCALLLQQSRGAAQLALRQRLDRIDSHAEQLRNRRDCVPGSAGRR